MPERTHKEWSSAVFELRERLTTEPGNLLIARELWAEMGTTSRYNVRTGQRAIETFRTCAVQSDEGLWELMTALISLADEIGEYPRSELFDPLLENLLRRVASQSGNTRSKDAVWVLSFIDDDL